MNATQVVEASPSCPAFCLLVESSLQFWGEGTAFLLLFNCASSFQAGHPLVVPQGCIQQGWAWEFCLISVHLSICSPSTGLSSLKSVFPWEAESSHSLPGTDYAACCCDEMHWRMWGVEKHPLYRMAFSILEMHKRCWFTAHFKFHRDWTFRDHL